jgi:ligand-binding sensor domain-containing protein
MKTTFLLIFSGLLIFQTGGLKSQVVSSYQFVENPDRGGLVGNGITDLLWSDINHTLYVGTGFGLSTTANDGERWDNFTPTDYRGKGGVSALAFTHDSTLWIATGYDTMVDSETRLSIGGGLRYFRPDSGWKFIPQPVDARDDTANGKRPTTTRVQNITYDIAILDTQIWIASFGGGVRRSLDRGKTWEVITTDGLPFGALAYLNHRGFSLLAEDDTIWVGTAGGISKSTDGGNTWRRFTHTNQNQPISGNFVIALGRRPSGLRAPLSLTLSARRSMVE